MICGDLKLLQNESVVSGLRQCETIKARYLSFIELLRTVQTANSIGIGSTFINGNPEFKFYYKLTASHIGISVISIFVEQMGQGQFTVTLPSEDNLAMLNDNLENYNTTSYAFHTKKPGEHNYLKSYYLLYKSDLEQPINLLPFKITSTPKIGLEQSVIKSIKYAHYKLNVDALKEDPFDIDLVSTNGTVHKCHKLIIAAHSPVLKQMIIDCKDSQLKLDVDDTKLGILNEFLYSGYIKDIVKYDPIKIFELANQYDLKNLWYSLQHPLEQLITIENAIELGVLAFMHDMDYLENKIFTFIKCNPATLKTQYWKELNDIVFIKRLLEFIHRDFDDDDDQ